MKNLLRIVARPAWVAALSLSMLSAQGVSVRIGITAQTTALLQQGDNCQVRVCNTSLPPIGASATAAGGTAFDGTTGGVWVSNGLLTSLVDPISCRELCAAQRILPDRAIVTGLAVYEPRRQLLVTDSANRIHIFDIQCPLQRAVRVCSLVGTLPSGHTLGGIAVDDVTGDIYFSSANFNSPQSPGNLLWVANMTSPCRPRCRLRVPNCGRIPLVPIHGVAFDGCEGLVWVTDGLRQVALKVDPTNCRIAENRCCAGGFVDPLAGLCILPPASELANRSCLARPCRVCPAPALTLRGSPMVGNPAFALQGRGLPTNSVVVGLLGAGKCLTPGTPIPGFCGNVAVPFAPAPLVLGPLPAQGNAFCDGTVTFPIPIPADPKLCGAVLCSQLVGVCAASPTPGTWIAQARQWQISYH